MSDPIEGTGRPKVTRVLFWCLLFAAVVRLAVFFIAYNYDGDPLIRTNGAKAWSQSPYLITHADKATWVFGPLPFYVNGIALRLWDNVQDSPRAVSLVFGILAIVPFFRLTQREFGLKPAIYATVAFCCYTLHVRYSTVTTSEAINAFLLLWAVSLVFLYLTTGRRRHLVGSIVTMNLATMVRYENLLLVVILAGILLGAAVTSGLEERWPIRFDRRKVTAALLFAGLSLVFLGTRLIGDYVYHGDPLYSVAVSQSHFQAMQQRGLETRGALWHHLYTVLFWPGVTVLSLSPVVGLLAFGNAARLIRRKRHLAYVVIPLGFLAAYIIQATLVKNMATFARYSLPVGIFILPLAGDLWHRLLVDRPRLWQRSANGIVFASVVVWFIFLAMVGVPETGALADKLSSVSPVSRLPQGMMGAIDWVNRRLPDSARVLIDERAGEGGLVRMYCRFPQHHVLLEWEDQAKIDSFLASGAPCYFVTFKGGILAKSWGLRATSGEQTTGKYSLSPQVVGGGYAVLSVARKSSSNESSDDSR